MTGEGRDFLPSQKETERDKLLPVEFLKSGPTDCGLVGGKVDSFSKKPIQDNGLVHVALHEAFSIGSNFALTKGDPVSLASSGLANCVGPSLPSHSMDIDKGSVL
ncbi:hypothetical protein ACSBR2_010177 [Camellia fascicularis]